MPDDLAGALRAVLPTEVALGVGDVTSPVALWPGEFLQNAVPSRLAEFSAGRTAARNALAQLGKPQLAIPMQADRAPQWPNGLTGSISHCSGACMALVAETRDFAGIGLDLEPALPIAPELWSTILRPEELASLRELQKQDQGLEVLKVFSAKEAAYKAQYAVSQCLFGFDGLSVSIADHRFMAKFALAVGPFPAGFELQGSFVLCDEVLAAVVLLPNFKNQ